MRPLGPTDPQRVGHYRLLGKLGAGGMGSVYLARSDRGRTVAVKLVQPELAAQPEFRQRFKREVDAARRVGGEWTAPVLDADTEAATPWVATGYVAGPSLHEVVTDTYGPLPERSVFLLANGLVKALRDIHNAGLIHRDLKPSNVMITIDGPRVIDFGIARALESDDAGLTRTGAAVGSPGFMSPEQCRGQALTPASDIFCLGSVLTFAATGRTPFGDPHTAMTALMLRIVQGEHELGDVPESVRPMIEACLHLDPAQRPSLEQLIQHTEIPDDGEPWLPGALVARLGRHAVELLDSEDPLQTSTGLGAGPVPQAGPPATPPPGPPPPPSGTGVNVMPTMASPTPPPGAYGYPPQTPQPPGYPQPAAQPGHTGYQAGHPGAPGMPPPGGKPGGRNNALLIGIAVAAALVIAIVIGVAVSGGDDDSEAGPTSNGQSDGGQTDGGQGDGGGDNGGGSDGGQDNGGTSGGPGQSQEATVPADMIGAWEGELSGGDDPYFQRIEIVQGSTGQTVTTQWTLGPTGMCVESSTLASSDGTTLTLQSAGITSETPPGAGCAPYGSQTLTLRGDTLHWEDDQGFAGDLRLAAMEDSGSSDYDGMPYSVFDHTFEGDGYEVDPETTSAAGETAFTISNGECSWTNSMISGGLDATTLLVGPGTAVSGNCDPLPSYTVHVNVPAGDTDAASLRFVPYGENSGGFEVERQ